MSKLNHRTYQRALREATTIRVEYHEREGVTWLIHRGWLAGFKAGVQAGKRRRGERRRG